MHGLPVLFVFALIAFFVVRAMFFSGKGAVAVPVRQIDRSGGTVADDDADDDDPELRELEELERRERRQRAGTPAAATFGGANPFEAMGLPKGLGGMVGALASAAATTAITSIVTDGEGGGEALAEMQSRLRESLAQAKRSGRPLDLKTVVAEVTGAAEAAAATNVKRAKNHQRTVAHRAPSGDDAGNVLAWRPPLDARPPLAPLKPSARLHPVKVLAERTPISA